MSSRRTEPANETITLALAALPGVDEPGPFQFVLSRHEGQRRVQIPVTQTGRDPELASPAQGRWLQALMPSAREVGPGTWRLGPRQWTRVLDTLEAGGGEPPWRAARALAAARAAFDAEVPGPGKPYRADVQVDEATRRQARAADLALLDQAVALAGGWVEPLLARAYRKLGWHGDPRGALADCDMAIALDSSEAQAWSQQAAAHRSLGQLDQELAALKRAVAQPTAGASHWHTLGECAGRARELHTARMALQRAAALAPDNPHHATTEALVLEACGELRQAEQILRQVVTRFDDYVLAQTSLGRLLVDHPERRAEARAALDAAVAAGPGYAFEALFLRGCLARLDGRPGDALRDLEAALELSPSMVEAHCELGLSLAALGRHQDALAHLDRYLQRSAWPPALRARARTLVALGFLDRARADLEAYLAADPGDPEASALMAELGPQG